MYLGDEGAGMGWAFPFPFFRVWELHICTWAVDSSVHLKFLWQCW